MASRSAKALAKSKLQQMAIEVDGGDDLPDDAVASDSEVERGTSGVESDYGKGKGKQKASSNRAPAKRAKISSRLSPSKTQKSQTTRPRKSLSLLPTMPLDVLFEIFGLLNPKDIMSLARTSKIFRETLMSRGAVTVWKTIRERLDAPDPPSDMSEPGWAALLFGNTCQHCGAKPVQNVDFRLRRRICVRCKKGGIIAESSLKKYFANLDKSILDLIPHTNTGGWSKGYKSRSRFFWIEDVRKMVEKVAGFKEDMRVRGVDAKKAFDDFKEERKKLFVAVDCNVRGYEEWVKNSHRERQMDKNALIDSRRDAIYERFMQLGYERDDVGVLRYEPLLTQPTLLTDRIWQRIRPILELQVQQGQKERLDSELADLRASRRNIVHELYQTYKKSLLPSQWRYLPRTLEICQLDPFAQFVDAPAGVTVTAKDFAHGVELLPELLSSRAVSKRKEFLDILSTRSEVGDGLESPEASSSHQGEGALDLATSVFECCHQVYGIHAPHTIVGLEELMTHHCEVELEGLSNSPRLYDYDFARPVQFSVTGAVTARSLVHLAGLDPETASASDMDDKNLRFSCSRCHLKKDYLGRWYTNGYSWRKAIAHAVGNYHYGQYNFSAEAVVRGSSWEILSDTIAEHLRKQEREDTKWQVSLWTCGHCSVYMGDLQYRADIVRHLEAEHAIVESKEPEDLFMFERFISGFNQQIKYTIPDPTDASSSSDLSIPTF